MEELIETFKENFKLKYQNEITFYEKHCVADFNIIAAIEHGTFGLVVAAKHTESKIVVALKILEKEHLIRKNQVTHISHEIKILGSIDFAFTTMPFHNGGDLFHHLRQSKKYSENDARFYSGQILLALQYLHAVGVVYRDIKPENIMFERNGYLKLVDFSFAKKIDTGRTYTFCGTPEYLPPEIILGKGYGMTVDWWSFGVLIYELNAGFSPFATRDTNALFSKIVNQEYILPIAFSPELGNLIGSLLLVDRSKRYGCLKDGIVDIKYHPWYHNLDWTKLFLRSIKPPYIPPVSGALDLSQFKHPTKDFELRHTAAWKFEKEFYNLQPY